MSTALRTTDIISGAKAIGKRFGVHEQTVVAWRKQGAPITYVGEYKAEAWELWCWLRSREKAQKGEI